VLELKAPQMPEHYQVEEVDGVTVYVPKRLPTKKGKITIIMDKILFIKRLDVLGVKVR
jgi:hypothetical protein